MVESVSHRGLRYFALGAATALTALLLVVEKISSEAAVGIVIAILGISGADIIKHRND